MTGTKRPRHGGSGEGGGGHKLRLPDEPVQADHEADEAVERGGSRERERDGRLDGGARARALRDRDRVLGEPGRVQGGGCRGEASTRHAWGGHAGHALACQRDKDPLASRGKKGLLDAAYNQQEVHEEEEEEEEEEVEQHQVRDVWKRLCAFPPALHSCDTSASWQDVCRCSEWWWCVCVCAEHSLPFIRHWVSQCKRLTPVSVSLAQMQYHSTTLSGVQHHLVEFGGSLWP